MLLFLSFLLTSAAAAPATTYNQAQNGADNTQAHIKDLYIIVGLPKNMSTIYDVFFRNSRRGNANIPAQNRADTRPDVQLMDAFVEPQTPYQVEIGNERSAGDGSVHVAEVVIPAKNLDTERHEDEMKLIGATEQCGPDRVRDPVTLTCRFREDTVPENTPEVVPAV